MLLSALLPGNDDPFNHIPLGLFSVTVLLSQSWRSDPKYLGQIDHHTMISVAFYIAFHLRASQLSRHVIPCVIDCDVISRTQTKQVRHGVDVWRTTLILPFMSSVYRVRNEIMYVLSWRTIYCVWVQGFIKLPKCVLNRIWWLYSSTLVELYKQLVLPIDHLSLASEDPTGDLENTHIGVH